MCSCDTPIQSWNDLPVVNPLDPRNVVANSQFGLAQGVFKRSTTFLQGSWAASAINFTGLANCSSLHGDDQLTVNNANQWNFSHKVVNTDSSLAIPMRKVMFMRGGRQWQMNIELDLGTTPYSDIQLSLRDNAASAGDFLDSTSGSIPVISYSGTFTAHQMFNVTIFNLGRVSMGLVMKNNDTGAYSMFEMEWVVVP